MKFRPLHDRVVVTRIDADDKTAGGIIIPDTAKEKPSEGEVIAVGPGGRDEAGKIIPIDLKVGDRVLFGKWSGTEGTLDGVEYLIRKDRHDPCPRGDILRSDRDHGGRPLWSTDRGAGAARREAARGTTATDPYRPRA